MIFYQYPDVMDSKYDNVTKKLFKELRKKNRFDHILKIKSTLKKIEEVIDSQTSERSGTIMMVPFPSESRERKETYPVPWGGIEPPKRFWVQGLPWGMIPFI